MKRGKPLKALFYLSLAIVGLLVGYKIYLNLFSPAFEAVHTEQVERVRDRLAGRDSFSFAVVGNINNSVGIFERKIIPMLNDAGGDFMISAGNAVSDGSEDKYRALLGSFSHLEMPYLLTFGQHEYENFGSFRFYEYFGPYFFSLRAGNSRLVFIDSTGKTPWRWQIRWLRGLLEQRDSDHVFLFTGHPVVHDDRDVLFDDDEDYLGPEPFRRALMALIREYRVDAVFSANINQYMTKQVDGTTFVTTGGAGGLVLNNDTSFYHFMRVTVDGEELTIEMVPLEVGQHPFLKQLESLWFFIYSLFYVGYLNFILLVGVLVIVTIKLYTLVFVGRDYYPDYDLDPTPWRDRPLRVALFTNNYLPFIGGVPLSIERLRQGLVAAGNRVLVVAPRYRKQPRDEEEVVRVPSVLSLGKKREFRIANIFHLQVWRRVRALAPDIIHVHHPFWLGSLGLFMARRLGVPAVYTYHTRLEHYAHFVPLPGALFRNLISHALVKRFANKCDAVIVPTYSTEEYLRIIGVKSPVYVQPTGIDYERFRAVGDDRVRQLRTRLGLGQGPVLISVSRLSKEKNIDFLIDGIAALARRTSQPFQLLWIGEGHERQRLQQRIEALGLGGKVRLVGAVPPDEMPVYYKLGDLFLFASRSETQGMVILEAMAAGLPVVAVRSSGIDDVVRQGYNGYKTPGDIDLWCDAIQSLLEDEPRRRELSAHALEFARDFSIPAFAGHIKEVYALVLAAKAKRSGDVGSEPE